MDLTPDAQVFWQWGWFKLNATIVYTWLVMAILVLISWLATRNLRPDVPPDPWRNLLEQIVTTIEQQVSEVSSVAIRPVMYFAGTLFLFIALANFLTIVPGYRAPTGSLSTTVALTIAVLVAVPLFSVLHSGPKHYVKQYFQPTCVMLPFNLLGEVSKGISLSIRLYGNIMSGAVIAAILLTIAPFFFPIIMEMLGLITGLIQAYIFAILATVYIAGAMADTKKSKPKRKNYD